MFGKGEHGSTFGGNPVACAAALAVIDTIESDDLLDHVAKVGEHFADGLARCQSRGAARRPGSRPVARARAHRSDRAGGRTGESRRRIPGQCRAARRDQNRTAVGAVDRRSRSLRRRAASDSRRRDRRCRRDTRRGTSCSTTTSPRPRWRRSSTTPTRLKKDRFALRPLAGPEVGRGAVREAVDPHPGVVRGRHRRTRRPSRHHRRRRVAARSWRDRSKTPRRCCRGTSARSCCARSAHDRIETLAAQCERAGRQRADRPRAPVPVAGRSDDDPRASRRRRPGRPSPTSATATTWRTRSCSAARSPACTCGSPRPPAIEPLPTIVAAGAAHSLNATGGSVTVTDDPVAASDRRRRALHRRLGVDGPGGRVRRSARLAFARLPARRPARRSRRRRRHGVALPAGPPRRGDRGLGHRRAAFVRLRRGREPVARPEGVAGVPVWSR